MKNIIFSALGLILAPTSPLYAAEAKEATCAQNQSVAIVDGMVCDFCAQSIKKLFMKETEVKDVEIDLTAKTVTIIPKDNQKIKDEKIGQLIDYAGYKLVKIDHGCGKG